MPSQQSSQLPPTPGPRCRDAHTVWCECHLPLYRGAGHEITRRQKRRHRRVCLEQHVPFTTDEANNTAESVPHENLHDASSVTHGTSTDVNLDTDTNDVQSGPDDDDRPYIADWMEDIAAVESEDIYEPLAQDLAMFDAFTGTPREKLKRMRTALRTYYDVDIGDPTQTGHKALDEAVGDFIRSEELECCSDGCVAYTGRLLNEVVCPTCGKARYDHQGRPRYTFQYIPLIPRLQLQYNHAARSEQLSSYRATFDPARPDDGSRNDVLDGSWFRECWADGYFRDDRDLAIRLTLDAVGTVKNPKKRQSVTPVVMYILNLPSHVRDDASNALVTHIIPGGFDKDYADTWLYPLVSELHLLRHGIRSYDGASKQCFPLKAHVILVTGDGPAIAEVMGTKNPGKAKQSCRMCTFTGTLGRGGKYFYPHAGDVVVGINMHLREHIEDVERCRTNGTSKREFDQLRRDLGIHYQSILLDIPTIHFPRSFPIDTMHSMNHNIPKSLFHLWKGSKYQKRGHGGIEEYMWVIPKTDWVLIDHSVAASRATVPTYVGTAPRSTSSFGNWTTHEWRSFFLTYGAPAVHHFLPLQYAQNFLRYRQLLYYTSRRRFTRAEVLEVQARAESFVREYKNLYYGGDPDLLPSCTIQFHYLLHLSQNIRDFSPPSGYAQ
jgi:hypothetical protein